MIRSLLRVTIHATQAFLEAAQYELAGRPEYEDWAVELDPDILYEQCPCDRDGCLSCFDYGIKPHTCD